MKGLSSPFIPLLTQGERGATGPVLLREFALSH